MAVQLHYRRIVYTTVCVLALLGAVQVILTLLTGPLEVDRGALLNDIYRLMQSSRSAAGGPACRHPYLQLFDPDIMQHITDSVELDCGNEPDWVEVAGNTARITADARARHGDIKCLFQDILRASDFATVDGESVISMTEYQFRQSDFVRVYCKARSGALWRNVLAGVRHDQNTHNRSGWDRLPSDALRLNVLMFGYDSLSRNMFIRKLPKTYRYLHETLRGVTLEGYNIVGDGTPQALIPILTGWTELELPDTRKRMGANASYVDVYPFIWNNFQKNGYVTAFLEDCPDTGTFTYRLTGFWDQPTDHYMRPYYLTASQQYSKHNQYCMGSIPRHKVMMNYIKNFFQTYSDEPRFLFGFHGELSHDAVNLIGAADDDMLEWLQSLSAEGHLNNTLLVVMSDHGHRFASIRNTLQGKQEERLPFFTFVFPPWFEQVHPKAMDNFRTNVHRLTSPFDIHVTLRAVLHFSGDGLGSITDRSISLFQEVPQERTCADAFIESHWCACLDWEEISLQDPLVSRAGEALVQHINRYTKDYRQICAELHVAEVQWASQLLPSQGLLHYYNNKDLDGFVGDMSDQTSISHKTIQVKVATQPGEGLFEASLTYSVQSDDFVVKMSDISRINQYGSDAHCVYEKYEHLRKYCYCETKE